MQQARTSRPIPVRFSDAEIEKITATAQRLGLGKSSLIRFCVNMFLRAYELNGNDVLPGNWETIVQSLDRRIEVFRKCQGNREQERPE